MAKRNRYREMESKMTLVLISAAVFFLLYLVCASFGLAVLKYILAVVSIVASALCLALVWTRDDLHLPSDPSFGQAKPASAWPPRVKVLVTSCVRLCDP